MVVTVAWNMPTTTCECISTIIDDELRPFGEIRAPGHVKTEEMDELQSLLDPGETGKHKNVLPTH